MCIAVPGKIIKIEGKMGTIDLMGVERDISLELLQDIKIGDYVIVHAGCAIQKLDEEEALKTIDIFKELEELTNE
jgi:hydrogenase expression/formation protein HypC